MNLQMLKKAMLAYVSAVKFVWSNMAYPLSIVGKKFMNLRGYRVYGNSVQDGTPTPDNPVEIESVGDLTEKNLLPYPYSETTKTENGITFTDNGDGTITVNGTATADTIFKIVSGVTAFSAEEYHYLSGCPENGNSNTYMLLGYTAVGASFFDYGSGVLTYRPNSKTFGIRILVRSGATLNNLVFKPQLEEGTTATDYEPYHKYTIPVVARGKNLATAQQVYSTAANYFECIEDGRNCIRCTSSGKSYAGINFKENTQYTVRFEAKTVIMSAYEEDGNGEALFAFTHTDGTRKLIVVYGSKDWKYYEATSLANKTIASVGMYAYNYKHWIYINVDTFQIEEGTTATEYEPYIVPVTTNIFLDEPLRKRRNYADYVEFEKQKVVRPVEVLDDTGTKTIDESLGVISPPTEETVKLPALPQFKGTTIYEVGTNIKPSGIEAKYC